MKTLLGLVIVALLAIGQEASATHFRGMTISYQQGTGANANQVTYRVTESWRRSFFLGAVVGNSVNVPAITDNISDSISGSTLSTIRLVNTSQDWMVSSRTFTKTYPSIGEYSVQFASCCRITALQDDNADSDIFVRTNIVMDAAGGARSPDIVGFDLGIAPTNLSVATLLPNNPFLVHLTNNAVNTFRLGVSLPGPSADWIYRIARAGPADDSGLVDATPGTPPKQLSLSPTGDFTWDTPNCLGCLYAFQLELFNTVTGVSWDYETIFTLTDQPLSNFWTLYTPTLPPEQPVPAPAAALLLGAGLLGLAGVSRRRRVAA